MVLICGNLAALRRILVPLATREATWRPNTAARYSSCDQPSSRAWSPSAANVAVITGALSSRARNATSPTTSLPPAPRRGHRTTCRAGATAGMAVRRADRTHRRSAPTPADPPRSRRRGGPRMAAVRAWNAVRSSAAIATLVGSVIVWCVDQHRTCTPTRAPAHVTTPHPARMDIHEPADHARVDRVVVAGNPHVVVPRQPHPLAAPTTAQPAAKRPSPRRQPRPEHRAGHRSGAAPGHSPAATTRPAGCCSRLAR